MVEKDPLRESHFPAIEKRYGQPMSFWFSIMKNLDDQKYPQQIAYLRENYGFSQAHANALVMYSRGSKSARRFNTVAEYYKTIDPEAAKTVRAIFRTIMAQYPESDLVIAWNQPMLRLDSNYIFGVSVSSKHILMSPWSSDVIEKFAIKMQDLTVKKKTIGIPKNWEVDAKLLLSLVKARVAEL